MSLLHIRHCFLDGHVRFAAADLLAAGAGATRARLNHLLRQPSIAGDADVQRLTARRHKFAGHGPVAVPVVTVAEALELQMLLPPYRAEDLCEIAFPFLSEHLSGKALLEHEDEVAEARRRLHLPDKAAEETAAKRRRRITAEDGEYTRKLRMAFAAAGAERGGRAAGEPSAEEEEKLLAARERRVQHQLKTLSETRALLEGLASTPNLDAEERRALRDYALGVLRQSQE